MKNEKPSLIINYTIKPVIYGSLAARLLGIPSFAVTTGLGFVFIQNNRLTRFISFLYRITLRFPEMVFFLNPDDRNAFFTNRLVDPSKAILLPGEGVDTSFYQPIHPANSKSGFIFLLISRLLREKGIFEFIEAVSIMKKGSANADFRILGYIDKGNPGSITRNQLQEWENAGMITYGGTSEDIRSEIAASGCIVLPSYREGVPRTLLEAASMEIPIIATDVPGCREVVDNGINGFLCEPRNSRDLYEKMVQMLNLSPAKRGMMGRAGREKVVAQFDEKIVTEIYLEEIKRVLKG